MIDNISFEPQSHADEGFAATQILANADAENGQFTPLIYHVKGTSGPDFRSKHARSVVQIELGNPPRRQLPGYPVGVFLHPKSARIPWLS
jgi:hypothetical protein